MNKTLEILMPYLESENYISDLILIDMRKAIDYTDYFLICNIKTKKDQDDLLKELRQIAYEKGLELKIEHDREWAIVDFGDIFLHVFLPRARQFYRLERLWSGFPQMAFPTPSRLISNPL